MTKTLDDISGKGDSYDFRGVIRRLGDQRGGKRQKGGTGVAGGCHAGNGIVHVQSKEVTLKHHLKLMVGRMVKLDVKDS